MNFIIFISILLLVIRFVNPEVFYLYTSYVLARSYQVKRMKGKLYIRRTIRVFRVPFKKTIKPAPNVGDRIRIAWLPKRHGRVPGRVGTVGIVERIYEDNTIILRLPSGATAYIDQNYNYKLA